jgi:uncharacterized protein YhfF
LSRTIIESSFYGKIPIYLEKVYYSIVTDWEHHPVCIIQTTEVNIVPFREIDAQFAYDYGEGERTLVWLKHQLWDYYEQECTLIGRQASEQMPLVCERFQVVYKR